MSNIRKADDDINHDETTNRTHDGDDLSPNAIDAASVSASESITDPEGNTVTSLSDPVRVTEEASTFTESDVIVNNNGTNILNESIKLEGSGLIDDFEDGDITIDIQDYNGWSEDTSQLTAQSNTVISGSFSAELSNSGGNTTTARATADSPTTEDINLTIRINSTVSTAGDRAGVQFWNLADSTSKYYGELRFDDTDDGTGEIVWSGDNTTLRTSWSADTNYDIELQLNFTNDEVTIIINATTEGTFSLGDSGSDWDVLNINNRTNNSNTARTIYFDDVSERREAATSGDALVSFDSGSPSDIDSWDLATLQKTFDNETVTIDVEDSNGNVLKSDISKDTDISDIATSTDVQFRANLSRNDTSNNPTLDYAARRFTR